QTCALPISLQACLEPTPPPKLSHSIHLDRCLESHFRSRMAQANPNDPKLSDREVRRGTCMAGGKAAAEAGAVTHGAVRCSAWLGVAGFGLGGQWKMKVVINAPNDWAYKPRRGAQLCLDVTDVRPSIEPRQTVVSDECSQLLGSALV